MRSVSKRGQPQPRFHTKARSLNIQLLHKLFTEYFSFLLKSLNLFNSTKQVFPVSLPSFLTTPYID